jgi:hypothetical protein
MQAYIQSIGAWEIVRPDLLATVEWLKGDGKSEIGVCFHSFHFPGSWHYALLRLKMGCSLIRWRGMKM